jgi:hypothetical protein
MAGKGGYQKPNNPATFSGPGKFSQRTDGGPGDMRQPQRDIPSAGYGEGVETAAIQAGAPLNQTSDAVAGPQETVRPMLTPLTGLFAETERPDEPITAGIDRGEGPGSSALRMNKVTVKLSDTLAQMLPFDTTGEIAVLYQEALSRGN